MQITNNQPIPEWTKNGKKAPCKYPFNDMKPGDSFEIKNDVDAIRLVRIACSAYGRRNNKSFAVRRCEDEITRCFRIE